METGSTQEEIEANDLLDSEWMGDSITLGIEATGKQVIDNPTTQYEVAFDLNGGTLENHGDSTQITKQVTYGETYGDLPRPTREGYTFVGWSRNLVDQINEHNYTLYNYGTRTTSELKNDGNFAGMLNQTYIRINGNSSESYVDTWWSISGVNSFNALPGENYILSFYARSENAKEKQGIYIHSNMTKDGNTGILWNNGEYTLLPNDAYFDNDGQWHLISIGFTVPEGATGGKIRIANDYPNLYGPGSYIDIGNIQFAKDNSTTTYWIQSSTQVSTQNNHTLIAKWEKDN